MSRKYKICLWSGGKMVENWLTEAKPEALPGGWGYRFQTRDDLSVEITGTTSIEEGHWEYEELCPRVGIK